MKLRSPMCRSTTMIAPVRFAASVLVATTSSSMVSSSLVSALEAAEDGRAAQVHQRPADVRLHQDDGREHDVPDDVADQPVEGFELEPQRHVEQPDDHGDANRHLHRAGPANELQQLVHDDRHDRDVEKVPPGDGGSLQQVGKPGHQAGRRIVSQDAGRPRTLQRGVVDGVGDADDRHQIGHPMHPDDVRAAQDGGGDGGGGRPVAVGRRQRPRGGGQERLA